MSNDPAEKTALFRYRLIAEAANPRLSAAGRGQLVRELASHTHELPDGSRTEVSRATLDRWIRAYRDGGLQALRPQPRSDQGIVRKLPELLDEACLLRRELPKRSAEQISRILLARHGVRISPRTLRQVLRRRGLDRVRLTGERKVYGRFEAEHPNELADSDAIRSPVPIQSDQRFRRIRSPRRGAANSDDVR